jgi:hypothetical protein
MLGPGNRRVGCQEDNDMAGTPESLPLFSSPESPPLFNLSQVGYGYTFVYRRYHQTICELALLG